MERECTFDKNNLLVSISCITYNHAPYIRQCLEGFIMQKTNFAFEVLIHDDASTDGTTEIIKEYETKYPDIIKPLYEEENQWIKGRKGSSVFNFPRAKGKYIALCEGDDYWIDPLKLQKQVDFLEANPEYGLIYTSAYVYNQSEQRMENYFIGNDARSFDDLVKRNCVPTLTACYRREFLSKYTTDIQPLQSWKMGDYPLWLYISLKSHIMYMNDKTAVYRKMEESASHSKSIDKKIIFLESSSDICRYFLSYANRWDLKMVYKEKYNKLIMSYYIQYDMPIAYSSVKKYWIWKPKFILKYIFSQFSITRKLIC